MTTHYHTLGIPTNATTERVKQTYRALVKKFHPDLFPSESTAQAEAQRRIRDVNVAYAVLSHPEKRESYDARLNIRTSRGLVGGRLCFDLHISPDLCLRRGGL